jgi:DNA-binding CsgD family transcriptional regulator
MSTRWNASRQSPAPRPERSNPFGAVSPAIDPHHTVTLADAVRRCRWIAVDINAAAFTLLLVGPPGEKRRLLPSFDSDYPVQSAMTRPLAAQIGEWAADRAVVSTIPCWWSDAPEARSHASFTGLAWAEGPVAGPAGTSGIAFPVYADRGQAGLVVFLGAEIALGNDTIADTHARCFALFAAVTRLKPADGGGTPTISKRELECLSLTANGLTSEEIAAELGLSVHTANQYLTNTAQKLDAVNRMHAVAKALRLGLID